MTLPQRGRMQEAIAEPFRGEHFLGSLMGICTIYDQNI